MVWKQQVNPVPEKLSSRSLGEFRVPYNRPEGLLCVLVSSFIVFYYIGSAEGHEYPNLQVGDEVNPRRFLR